MKLSQEDLAEIMEVLKDAEQFRPLVRTVLDTIKSFGPEIEEIPKVCRSWIVKERIASIKQYRDAGFSKADAILMTLDDRAAMRRISESINKGGK